MANKQKIKGKGYERTIAKIFSETFGKNFMRVQNSGAFFGGQNAFRLSSHTAEQAKLFSGDIIPPENWSLLIECKARKDFKFHLMLRNQGNLDLNSWIEQASIDYEKSKINLMLIVFRPNCCGDYVCYEANSRESSNRFEDCTNFISYEYKNKTYYITELQEFLTLNKERIEQICCLKQ